VVRPTQGDATWSHGGTLPGTTAMLVRTYHGFSLVGVLNARSLTASLEAELYGALWNGLAGVTAFPAHDLFSTFR
jgi:N-acyl-D-amino-acid deacylase